MFKTYEDVLNAIQQLVDNTVSKINFDSTQLGVITEIGSPTGVYKVKINNKIFSALSSIPNLNIGESVYVTVPNNDYGQDKIIIGRLIEKKEEKNVFARDSYLALSGNLLENFNSVDWQEFDTDSLTREKFFPLGKYTKNIPIQYLKFNNAKLAFCMFYFDSDLDKQAFELNNSVPQILKNENISLYNPTDKSIYFTIMRETIDKNGTSNRTAWNSLTQRFDDKYSEQTINNYRLSQIPNVNDWLKNESWYKNAVFSFQFFQKIENNFSEVTDESDISFAGIDEKWAKKVAIRVYANTIDEKGTVDTSKHLYYIDIKKQRYQQMMLNCKYIPKFENIISGSYSFIVTLKDRNNNILQECEFPHTLVSGEIYNSVIPIEMRQCIDLDQKLISNFITLDNIEFKIQYKNDFLNKARQEVDLSQISNLSSKIEIQDIELTFGLPEDKLLQDEMIDIFTDSYHLTVDETYGQNAYGMPVNIYFNLLEIDRDNHKVKRHNSLKALQDDFLKSNEDKDTTDLKNDIRIEWYEYSMGAAPALKPLDKDDKPKLTYPMLQEAGWRQMELTANDGEQYKVYERGKIIPWEHKNPPEPLLENYQLKLSKNNRKSSVQLKIYVDNKFYHSNILNFINTTEILDKDQYGVNGFYIYLADNSNGIYNVYNLNKNLMSNFADLQNKSEDEIKELSKEFEDNNYSEYIKGLAKKWNKIAYLAYSGSDDQEVSDVEWSIESSINEYNIKLMDEVDKGTYYAGIAYSLNDTLQNNNIENLVCKFKVGDENKIIKYPIKCGFFNTNGSPYNFFIDVKPINENDTNAKHGAKIENRKIPYLQVEEKQSTNGNQFILTPDYVEITPFLFNESYNNIVDDLLDSETIKWQIDDVDKYLYGLIKLEKYIGTNNDEEEEWAEVSLPQELSPSTRLRLSLRIDNNDIKDGTSFKYSNHIIEEILEKGHGAVLKATLNYNNYELTTSMPIGLTNSSNYTDYLPFQGMSELRYSSDGAIAFNSYLDTPFSLEDTVNKNLDNFEIKQQKYQLIDLSDLKVLFKEDNVDEATNIVSEVVEKVDYISLNDGGQYEIYTPLEKRYSLENNDITTGESACTQSSIFNLVVSPTKQFLTLKLKNTGKTLNDFIKTNEKEKIDTGKQYYLKIPNNILGNEILKKVYVDDNTGSKCDVNGFDFDFTNDTNRENYEEFLFNVLPFNSKELLIHWLQLIPTTGFFSKPLYKVLKNYFGAINNDECVDGIDSQTSFLTFVQNDITEAIKSLFKSTIAIVKDELLNAGYGIEIIRTGYKSGDTGQFVLDPTQRTSNDIISYNEAKFTDTDYQQYAGCFPDEDNGLYHVFFIRIITPENASSDSAYEAAIKNLKEYASYVDKKFSNDWDAIQKSKTMYYYHKINKYVLTKDTAKQSDKTYYKLVNDNYEEFKGTFENNTKYYELAKEYQETIDFMKFFLLLFNSSFWYDTQLDLFEYRNPNNLNNRANDPSHRYLSPRVREQLNKIKLGDVLKEQLLGFLSKYDSVYELYNYFTNSTDENSNTNNRQAIQRIDAARDLTKAVRTYIDSQLSNIVTNDTEENDFISKILLFYQTEEIEKLIKSLNEQIDTGSTSSGFDKKSLFELYRWYINASLFKINLNRGAIEMLYDKIKSINNFKFIDFINFYNDLCDELNNKYFYYELPKDINQVVLQNLSDELIKNFIQAHIIQGFNNLNFSDNFSLDKNIITKNSNVKYEALSSMFSLPNDIDALNVNLLDSNKTKINDYIKDFRILYYDQNGNYLKNKQITAKESSYDQRTISGLKEPVLLKNTNDTLVDKNSSDENINKNIKFTNGYYKYPYGTIETDGVANRRLISDRIDVVGADQLKISVPKDKMSAGDTYLLALICYTTDVNTDGGLKYIKLGVDGNTYKTWYIDHSDDAKSFKPFEKGWETEYKYCLTYGNPSQIINIPAGIQSVRIYIGIEPKVSNGVAESPRSFESRIAKLKKLPKNLIINKQKVNNDATTNIKNQYSFSNLWYDMIDGTYNKKDNNSNSKRVLSKRIASPRILKIRKDNSTSTGIQVAIIGYTQDSSYGGLCGFYKADGYSNGTFFKRKKDFLYVLTTDTTKNSDKTYYVLNNEIYEKFEGEEFASDTTYYEMVHNTEDNQGIWINIPKQTTDYKYFYFPTSIKNIRIYLRYSDNSDIIASTVAQHLDIVCDYHELSNYFYSYPELNGEPVKNEISSYRLLSERFPVTARGNKDILKLMLNGNLPFIKNNLRIGAIAYSKEISQGLFAFYPRTNSSNSWIGLQDYLNKSGTGGKFDNNQYFKNNWRSLGEKDENDNDYPYQLTIKSTENTTMKSMRLCLAMISQLDNIKSNIKINSKSVTWEDGYYDLVAGDIIKNKFYKSRLCSTRINTNNSTNNPTTITLQFTGNETSYQNCYYTIIGYTKTKQYGLQGYGNVDTIKDTNGNIISRNINSFSFVNDSENNKFKKWDVLTNSITITISPKIKSFRLYIAEDIKTIMNTVRQHLFIENLSITENDSDSESKNNIIPQLYQTPVSYQIYVGLNKKVNLKDLNEIIMLCPNTSDNRILNEVLKSTQLYERDISDLASKSTIYNGTYLKGKELFMSQQPYIFTDNNIFPNSDKTELLYNLKSCFKINQFFYEDMKSFSQNYLDLYMLRPELTNLNEGFYLSERIKNLTDAYSLQIQWTDGNKKYFYFQPLIIDQNNYPSSLINTWDANTSIQEGEDGYVSASQVISGIKNNNKFSGVILGNTTSSGAANDLSSENGIYGFSDGEKTYSLSNNGMLSLGARGNNQINLDGASGILTSGNYVDSARGSMIDLTSGLINSYNFAVESKNLLLNSSNSASSFFEIVGNNNNTLFNLGENNCFIQSASYDNESESGAFFDLVSGNLRTRNGNIAIESSQTKNVYSNFIKAAYFFDCFANDETSEVDLKNVYSEDLLNIRKWFYADSIKDNFTVDDYFQKTKDSAPISTKIYYILNNNNQYEAVETSSLTEFSEDKIYYEKINPNTLYGALVNFLIMDFPMQTQSYKFGDSKALDGVQITYREASYINVMSNSSTAVEGTDSNTATGTGSIDGLSADDTYVASSSNVAIYGGTWGKNSTTKQRETELAILKFLINTMNFSLAVACGILANIEAESNFKETEWGDGYTSYGICQWHADRRKNLFKYTGSTSPSITQQLNFLKYELSYGYKKDVTSYLQDYSKESNSAEVAEKAARRWCYGFERPDGGRSWNGWNTIKRGNHGRRYYEHYSKKVKI